MRLGTEPIDHGVRVLGGGFQNQRPGNIIFPTAIYREKLLRAGLVELVVPEVPSEITEDVPAAPMNRAVAANSRKRR